jgi:hypothetical protein
MALDLPLGYQRTAEGMRVKYDESESNLFKMDRRAAEEKILEALRE